MRRTQARRAPRPHRELLHEAKGYSVVFEKGTGGIALHSAGVAGRAFFTKRADAVEFKCGLEQHGLKSLKPRVVKAVAALTAWAPVPQEPIP